MTIAPTLQPQVYQVKPTPKLVMMQYDGTKASFDAIQAWLTNTFDGENVVSVDEPATGGFSIRSSRLYSTLYHLQTGLGPVEHTVEAGDWIWVTEEMIISVGTQVPMRHVGYTPVPHA